LFSLLIIMHVLSFADKMGAEDVHLRAVIKAAAASFPRTHPNPIITRTTIYKCKNFSVRDTMIQLN